MEKDTVDRSRLAKGEYADFFEVGHDFVAFYLDCGQANESHEVSYVYNRIITTPIGARRLSDVLSRALREYIRRYGEIRDEHGLPYQQEEMGEEMNEH